MQMMKYFIEPEGSKEANLLFTGQMGRIFLWLYVHFQKSCLPVFLTERPVLKRVINPVATTANFNET